MTEAWIQLSNILKEYNAEHNNCFTEYELNTITELIMSTTEFSEYDWNLKRDKIRQNLHLFKGKKHFYTVLNKFIDKIHSYGDPLPDLMTTGIELVDSDPDHQISDADYAAYDQAEMDKEVWEHEADSEDPML